LYDYPLSGLLQCVHCDKLAQAHQNPKFRSRLGGTTSGDNMRYRHKGGVACGCTNRSVTCHEVEADFARLVKLLTVHPEALDLMMELAIQIERKHGNNDVDFEEQKQSSIALCRRRIEAAVNLYRDGVISREDYLADVERNEREIIHWDVRTSETREMAAELTLCMEAVGKLADMWDVSDAEEQQSLAQGLFTEIIFDLDTRRIVDFKLKPWADRFLTLRASLYADETTDTDLENELKSVWQGEPQSRIELSTTLRQSVILPLN
jgi:hypothetical protein